MSKDKYYVDLASLVIEADDPEQAAEIAARHLEHGRIIPEVVSTEYAGDEADTTSHENNSSVLISEVKAWLGSDMSFDELAAELTLIANRAYSVKQLRKDIISYEQEES